ncbi:hypothetical protein [Maricurvus nonylphenolicus]|uniref:hypothetical protein n=1 Tax=Maricurvus nonylphenolicus TaxID=1008307 RepID=UPI0036F32413
MANVLSTRLLLAVTLLAMLGCSGIPKDDFKQKFGLASDYFGPHFEFFYVPSYGWIADREFVKLTPLGDPSADAYQLAQMLSLGATQTTRVAVYSPTPEKAHNILRNALYLQHGEKLPYLEILVIGKTDDVSTIEEDVLQVDAKFHAIHADTAWSNTY